MKNILSKISIVIIIILALTSMFYSKKYSNTIGKLNDITMELEGIKKEKPKEIIVKNSEVVYRYRDGRVITRYKVPEGYVKINLEKYDGYLKQLEELERKKEDILDKSSEIDISVEVKEAYKDTLKVIDDKINAINNEFVSNKKKDIVSIKNRGFTFKPQVGVGYNGGISPYFGVKIAYWDRYGLNIGTTDDQVGLGISRYIDDFIPYFDNTQILLLGGLPYRNGGYVFLGLSLNL